MINRMIAATHKIVNKFLFPQSRKQYLINLFSLLLPIPFIFFIISLFRLNALLENLHLPLGLEFDNLVSIFIILFFCLLFLTWSLMGMQASKFHCSWVCIIGVFFLFITFHPEWFTELFHRTEVTILTLLSYWVYPVHGFFIFIVECGGVIFGKLPRWLEQMLETYRIYCDFFFAGLYLVSPFVGMIKTKKGTLAERVSALRRTDL